MWIESSAFITTTTLEFSNMALTNYSTVIKVEIDYLETIRGIKKYAVLYLKLMILMPIEINIV